MLYRLLVREVSEAVYSYTVEANSEEQAVCRALEGKAVTSSMIQGNPHYPHRIIGRAVLSPPVSTCNQ